ncbi:MAG: glycosyltransferase family 39 protein [Chloroherpetonaceae bacterium]|nr:glycosyltransferase family 39 protein [Chloroherpetonaceae bacterium]
MSAFLERLSFPVLTRLCGLSLLLRVGFVFVVQPSIVAVEDFNIAEHLARSDGFAYGGFDDDFRPTALKSPAYPLFLATFLALFGEQAKIVVVLVQHALAAFSPILLWRIGESLNEARLGKIAALLFLSHPSHFYYPTVLEVTNLFAPLAILWLFFSIRLARAAPMSLATFGFGLFSGVLVLAQPVALLPVVATLVFAFRRRLKSLALILLALLAPMSVWTARNLVVFGKAIPTKSPFYMNLYVGLLPEHSGLKAFEFLDDETIRRIDSLRQSTSDVEMEAHYKEVSLNAVRRKPLLYAAKTLWQAALYWFVPPRYFGNLSLSFVAVRLLPVLILNALFAWGLARLWRRRPDIAIAIALTLTYFTAVYALTHVSNIRFKLDIEWLELFACAAAFDERKPTTEIE